MASRPTISSAEARQGEGDDLLGAGAVRDQQMRELVGAGVEGA